MKQKNITRIIIVFFSIFTFMGCAPMGTPIPKHSASSIQQIKIVDSKITILPCEPIDPANFPAYACAGTEYAKPYIGRHGCTCLREGYVAIATTKGKTCVHESFLLSYGQTLVQLMKKQNVRPLSRSSVLNAYPSCGGSESCSFLVIEVLGGEQEILYVYRGLMLEDAIRLLVMLNSDVYKPTDIDMIFRRMRHEMSLAGIDVSMDEATENECLIAKEP